MPATYCKITEVINSQIIQRESVPGRVHTLCVKWLKKWDELLTTGDAKSMVYIFGTCLQTSLN